MRFVDFSPVSSTTIRLIKARAESIVHDRIRTADPTILGRKLVASPSYEVILTESLLTLLVYPKSTFPEVERRNKRFGSPIPRLFDVTDIRSAENDCIFRIEGDNNAVVGNRSGGEYRKLIAESGVKSIFSLRKDIIFNIKGITASLPEYNIYYEVPLAFTIAFGIHKRITKADEYLDSAVTLFLDNLSLQQSQDTESATTRS